MAGQVALGVGHGSIFDWGDGTIEYRPTGKIMPAFRVTVADITGFSVRKATKQDKKNGASAFQVILAIQGSGTELASVAVGASTPSKIEAYIRAHPNFGANAPQRASAAHSSGSLAEELTKLAALRDAGVLSSGEFESAKARLLAGP